MKRGCEINLSVAEIRGIAFAPNIHKTSALTLTQSEVLTVRDSLTDTRVHEPACKHIRAVPYAPPSDARPHLTLGAYAVQGTAHTHHLRFHHMCAGTHGHAMCACGLHCPHPSLPLFSHLSGIHTLLSPICPVRACCTCRPLLTCGACAERPRHVTYNVVLVQSPPP